MDWIIDNYIEFIGAFLGIIYLFFSVAKKIWLWPTGILTSAFYIIVFYYQQLYADMSLNVYYLIVSVYGWIYWLSNNNRITHNELKISVLTKENWIIYLLETFTLTIIFAWILKNIPQKIGLLPSAVPWWDAFLTSSSIIATWMLARKKLDQWLWWIVIDSISVGVFLYKNMYATAILFVFNTIMAVIGYNIWKKEYKLQ